MPKNPELELAFNFINKTDRNLFITGKAGTGKTTFLHQIKKESLKRMVIVAPTGVAAINAKGVTIHSFFQMPFGPILPNQIANTSNQQRKFSKTKIDIIKSLDLVIIDEISMVRADLLDGIDQVLRRYKNRNKVFGGAQVLMIGDLQQLAPVVKPNEWSLLQQHYHTVYFFSSKAYQEANVVSIELKHIYRQKNDDFINILNEIRNDNLSEKSAKILNERYNPTFSPSKEKGYITLTTHNNRATLINNSELQQLTSKSYFFEAIIKGTPSHAAHPNADNPLIKIPAVIKAIESIHFDKVSPVLGPVKVTLTQIEAGSQHNVVPSEVKLVIDVRVNECYTNSEIEQQLKETLPCEVNARSLRLKSSSIDSAHPLIKAGIALGKKTYGSPTLSDQAALDCPSLKLGPGDSTRSHSADEYIYVKEIEEGIIPDPSQPIDPQTGLPLDQTSQMDLGQPVMEPNTDKQGDTTVADGKIAEMPKGGEI